MVSVLVICSVLDLLIFRLRLLGHFSYWVWNKDVGPCLLIFCLYCVIKDKDLPSEKGTEAFGPIQPD